MSMMLDRYNALNVQSRSSGLERVITNFSLLALCSRFRIFGHPVPKDSKPQTKSKKGFGPGLGPRGALGKERFTEGLGRALWTRYNDRERGGLRPPKNDFGGGGVFICDVAMRRRCVNENKIAMGRFYKLQINCT